MACRQGQRLKEHGKANESARVGDFENASIQGW